MPEAEISAVPLGTPDVRFAAALEQLKIQDPAPADLPGRIAILQDALSRLKREENPNLWAAMEYDLAVCLQQSPVGEQRDNAAQARDAFASALLVYDEQKNPHAWASTQLGLAAAIMQSALPGDGESVSKARIAFEATLRVYHRERFPQQWEAVQRNLSWLDGTEDPPEIRFYRQIAKSIDREKDPEAYARTQAQLGALWRDCESGQRGANLENALGAVGLARAALTESKNRELWAHITRDLAGIYQRRLKGDKADNLDVAIRLLNEALGVFTREMYPKEYARTQHNLGMAYVGTLAEDRAGNARAAIDAFQQAVSVFEANPGFGSPAPTYIELSAIYFARTGGNRANNLDLAVRYEQAAVDALAESPDVAMRAGALMNLGTMLLERQKATDIEKAIEVLEQAKALRSEAPAAAGIAEAFQTRDLVTALNSLSLAYRKRTAGDPAENRTRAIEAGSEALRLSPPRFNATLCMAVAMNLGALLAEHGDYAQAYDVFLQAKEAADLLYGTTLTPESRRAYTVNLADVAEKLVDAALRKTPPSPASALEHAEHARSRALGEEIAAAEVLDSANMPVELRMLQSGSAERLRKYKKMVELTPQGDLRSQMVRVAEKYRWYRDAARAEVRRNRSGMEPPLWDAIQHWLGEQSREVAIVEYCSLPDRLLAFVARKGFSEPVVREISFQPKDIRDVVERHSAEVRKRPASDAPEQWLAMAAPLVEAISADLKGSDLLYLVPDRDLYRLPLHAIPLAGTPLIEQYATAYAPSIAILMSHPVQRAEREEEILVVGNATGDLPGAETEATAVAARFGVTPLIGAEATLEAVRARLAHASAAHIATHAFFDSADPLDSGLRLAEGKVLTVRDILLLERTPATVILSACETGVQEIGPGNDANGLPRAFLAGGTSVLVQSLWNVSDVSTSSLIQTLYQHLGNTAVFADALQRAMLEERSRNANSFYWAPFLVFGRGTA